jgi:hypothetical protein
MSTSYEALAARAERGELAVKPGTARRGEAAAHDEIRGLLIQATGASTVQEAATIAVGRPRLGAQTGQSPVVRARVPQALKERVAALAEREHRAESDIVREALAAYVEMKRVS